MFQGLHRYDSVMGIKYGKNGLKQVIKGILYRCDSTGRIKQLKLFSILTGTELVKDSDYVFPYNKKKEQLIEDFKICSSRVVLFEKHIVLNYDKLESEDWLTPEELRTVDLENDY